jgi:molecular chaperone GrpE
MQKDNDNIKNEKLNADVEAELQNLAKSYGEEQVKKQGKKPKAKKNKYELEISDLKTEIEKLKGELIRSAADSENLRKRTRKEVEDSAKYAVSSFAKDLINVMENLHRALSSVPVEKLEESKLVRSIYDGVELTKKELEGVFQKNSIKRISPEVGEQFNHNYHQAITQVPTDEHEEGAVVNVIQAGYMINDRLLTPAMVAVAKAT